MRILYITPTRVGDLSAGAAQRGTHLGRVLSELGDVTVEVARELEVKWSLMWFVRRTIGCVFPGMLFPLTRVELGSYDLVVVRYMRYAAYYGAWRFGQLYIDADDVPMDVCPRWARRAYGIWTRWVARKAEAVWVANPEDVGRIGVRCEQALENIPLLPKDGFRFACERLPRLITVGHLGYGPNRDGIAKFLKTRWPRMKAARPELEFRIIGKGLPASLARKWSRIDGVKLLGYVEDLEHEYEVCEAVVCPVESGGGTNIKVMEALARKRELIATDFAMKGIGTPGNLETFKRQVTDGLRSGNARRIPVVFGFDENYALAASVAIRTLIESAQRDTRYEIIVLHGGLSARTMRRMETITSVRWIRVDRRRFRDYPKGWSGEATWYRLLLAEVLPEFDRVIWSDVDVVFKADLSDVFSMELEGADWAGVAESKDVFIPSLMVANLRRWRETDFLSRCESVVRQEGARLKMFDLDVLNRVSNRIVRLGPEWGVFERLLTKGTAAPEYVKLRETYSEQEIKDAVDSPRIIHFAGPPMKVWLRRLEDMTAGYEQEVVRSPFWDTDIQQGGLRTKFKGMMFALLYAVTRDIAYRRKAGVYLRSCG